jgi:MFS superfamily sulfate permease-like transporter
MASVSSVRSRPDSRSSDCRWSACPIWWRSRHRYDLDTDQELLALGAANVATGISQGMTADASLSMSATAEAAGGKSQLVGLVAAALVLVTVLLLAPLFASLPNAVLAAIVISSVSGLMDTAELARYRASRRTDFVLALVALMGVVLSSVLVGLMLAVLLSLIIVLYRASRPYVALLGRVPGQRAAFGDIFRHPEYEQIPGLIIFRLDAPLFFANASVARKEIHAAIGARLTPPEAILVDLGATADLDIASADMLEELVTDLRDKQIEVFFAQVRGSVRDRMRKTGLMKIAGEEHIFYSIEGAVHYFQHERTPLQSPAITPTTE